MSGSEPERPRAQPDPATVRKVYEEARRIAHSVLRHRGRQTWGTTILVHEAFTRLLGGQWAERVHRDPHSIVPVLRRVMENALTDHRRRKHSAKRPDGDARARVYYEDGMTAFDDDPSAFLELLRIMERLREGRLGPINVSDPQRFSETLELGFVLGCSAREIAQQVEVPQTTVSRWLRYGRALLNQALEQATDGPPDDTPRSNG